MTEPPRANSADPDLPTADQELLPEFQRTTDGLAEPDVDRLRSLFGTEFVNLWIDSAKARGLIEERRSGDAGRRLRITEAGHDVYREIFPDYIEVGLPPRRGTSVPRRLLRLLGR